MLSSIHPFPARMAPSIVMEELHQSPTPLTIVDPMVGSGTSIVAARLKGHRALGFDVDPLAVLISRSWSADVCEEEFQSAGEKALQSARRYFPRISQSNAYPVGADPETKAFVRFWFDPISRRQLTALSIAIQSCMSERLQNLLWCAFSRMIITKSEGVSLAMDVSHSRPHRTYETSPHKPFQQFERSIIRLGRASLFKSPTRLPLARIAQGDARRLPLRTASADVVVTSPPYLNAIDYLRGHRLSLVWMGHSLSSLRKIRRDAIGSDNALRDARTFDVEEFLSSARTPKNVPLRLKGVLARYIRDMSSAISEMERVLKPGGRLILVVGNSTTNGFFINTSAIVSKIAARTRLKLVDISRRTLPDNRRYLPPPGSRKSGEKLRKRMRSEVILKFKKASFC